MRKVWGIAAFVGVLGLLLAPVRASANATVDETMRLLNESRAAAGVGPLQLDQKLSAVAQAHAELMAGSGQLRHNGDLPNQVEDWTRLGENVGVGRSVPELHEAFLNSASHRANVLESDWRDVGLGVAQGNGSLWVVHVFRQPGAVVALPAAPAVAAPANTAAPAPTAVVAPPVADVEPVRPEPQPAAQVVPAPGYSATLVALALIDPEPAEAEAMAPPATSPAQPVTRTAPIELRITRQPFEARHLAAAVWLAVALMVLRSLPQHRLIALRVRV